MNDPDDIDDIDAIAALESADALLAALAEADSSAAPASVRDAVLKRAASTPRSGAAPESPVTVYRARVADLAALLATLEPQDWARPAAPYDWTVHGLLAHLLVIERYTAAQLGLGPMPEGNQLHHLDLGERVIATELVGDPRATAERWRRTAQDIVDHISRPGFDLSVPLPLHQWPFEAGTSLVVRGFELWTHADDIRRAIGRAVSSPSAGELRTMSATSVTSLPLALSLVEPDVEMEATRVALTGPGGGTFDLAGATRSDRTLIALDVVDYCRLVARRIPVEELDCDIEGNARLAGALFKAASIVAM
jgi:uncharacterized protein (TIGR03083 family)